MGQIEVSLANPAVSDCYTTHLKLENAIAIKFILQLNNLEVSAHYGSNGILQSEHMFHQLLTNKLSCYENSTQREGNVFGIELVAAPDSNMQQSGKGPAPGGSGQQVRNLGTRPKTTQPAAGLPSTEGLYDSEGNNGYYDNLRKWCLYEDEDVDHGGIPKIGGPGFGEVLKTFYDSVILQKGTEMKRISNVQEHLLSILLDKGVTDKKKLDELGLRDGLELIKDLCANKTFR